MMPSTEVQARREILHSLLRIIHDAQLVKTRYYPANRYCVAELRDGSSMRYNDRGELIETLGSRTSSQTGRKDELA